MGGPAAARRRSKLRIKYGLTEAEFRRMVEEQGDRCAACGTSFEGRAFEGAADVDHDHRTGRVRALLCGNCNGALGLLHDDPERVRVLLTYILRYM